jgi:hypothetical protein
MLLSRSRIFFFRPSNCVRGVFGILQSFALLQATQFSLTLDFPLSGLEERRDRESQECLTSVPHKELGFS